MATEIDAERNDHLLRLKKTATELAAVIISATSLFVTIIAVLFAAFAMFKAEQAIKVAEESARESRLTQVYVQELEVQIDE